MAVSGILRPLLRIFPLYRFILRPLLFSLQPESAQKVAEFTLKVRPLWSLHRILTGTLSPALSTPMNGFEASNPIGLAAGFDKKFLYLKSLSDIGFGYLVCGTVTRLPRSGNPKPRLLRNMKEKALVNSLGFPGDGLDLAVNRLQLYNNSGFTTPVIASIAALDEQDTLHCLKTLEPFASAIELNISSPNTTGVKEYQSGEKLRLLLEKLNLYRRKPLFVKLPPWWDDKSQEVVLTLVRICKDTGVDGVTAFNTMPTDNSKLAVGKGGLSGKPLFENMLNSLPAIRSMLGPVPIINACGGVSSSLDIIRALSAGANSVQLYTSMIFRGPGLINSLIHELNEEFAKAKNA